MNPVFARLYQAQPLFSVLLVAAAAAICWLREKDGWR
jgi:hypothetical protein